jgi:thymidylate kinase
MIFHSGNIVFFHPGKTGGTSIEVALTKKYLDKDFPPVNPREVADYDLMYGYCRKHKLFLHHADVRFYQIVNKEIPKDYTKIVSVRRPYEKVLSAYYYNGHNNKIKFEDFVKNNLTNLVKRNKEFARNHFCPQINYILDDFKVIKLENIKQDCLDLGITITEKKHCETRASEDYKNYISAYSEETLEIINKLYAEDFERLNYDIHHNPLL